MASIMLGDAFLAKVKGPASKVSWGLRPQTPLVLLSSLDLHRYTIFMQFSLAFFMKVVVRTFQSNDYKMFRVSKTLGE